MEGPDPDTGFPVTLTQYEYFDDTFPAYAIRTDFIADMPVQSRTYVDGFGREIQSWQSMEEGYSVTDTFYDQLGRTSKVTFPYQSFSEEWLGRDEAQPSTESTYDIMGRIVTITDPNGTLTTTYDDWQKTLTDNAGVDKDFYFNAYGELAQVTEHNGDELYDTFYTYDQRGNLSKIVDAQRNEMELFYNSLSQKIEQELLHRPDDPLGSWYYTYDENGNLKTQLDSNEQTILYEYDQVDRISGEDYYDDGSTDVTYTYDSSLNGIGMLSSVTYEDIGLELSYDAAGNVNIEQKSIDDELYETITTYDASGKVRSVTYPESSITVYNIYNNAGYLESVIDSDLNSYIENIDYNPRGVWVNMEYGNGSISSVDYDPELGYRLTGRTTLASDGSSIQDLSYEYDDAGNIEIISDSSDLGFNIIFDHEYDDLGRLSYRWAEFPEEDLFSPIEIYFHDEVNNLTYKREVFHIDYGWPGYHPHATHHSVMFAPIRNDGNGNMTEFGDRDYVWDIKNRLISVEEFEFKYDYSGKRVQTLYDGIETARFVNQYLDIRESPIHHIHAGYRTHSIVDGEIRTYHFDHLGTATHTTNEEGLLVHINEFDPYGEPRLDVSIEGDTEIPEYTFIGKDYENEIGLYYFESRWLSTDIGSFISIDPVHLHNIERLIYDPQSLNAYTYSRNNPVALIDPSGEIWHVAIGAASGATLSVAGRLITDVATGNKSSLGDYAGSIAGGAVSGGLTAALGPGATSVFLAGGAGGATDSITRQTLNGGQFEAGDLVQSVIGETVSGFIPGVRLSGRNNIKAVASQMNTKFRNGTIKNIKPKTGGKMFVGNTFEGTYGQLVNSTLGQVFDSAHSAWNVDSFSNSGSNYMQQTPSYSSNANVNSFYTVRSGDTLSGLFGNNWRAVAEYNNISNPDVIFVGQSIGIPSGIKSGKLN